jgi:hypothetical protein
LILSKALKA